MTLSTISEVQADTVPVAHSSTAAVAVSAVKDTMPIKGGVQAGRGRNAVRKVLLGCGVLSSILYVGCDVYAWTQYPGYSPVSHAFSELLAEGAPTRAFMVAVA